MVQGQFLNVVVQELDNDEKFTMDHCEKDNSYSLLISQISPHESGCYQCLAENAEGADSTIAFIKVKGQSQRPSYHSMIVSDASLSPRGNTGSEM